MRILKLFKKHVLALFTAIVLIVISCNADLALPTYMSDIVDVACSKAAIASPVADTFAARIARRPRTLHERQGRQSCGGRV